MSLTARQLSIKRQSITTTISTNILFMYGPIALAPPRHILLKCLNQTRKGRLSICVLAVYIFLFLVLFFLDFGTVRTVWYFLFFILLFLMRVQTSQNTLRGPSKQFKQILFLKNIYIVPQKIYLNRSDMIQNTVSGSRDR